MDSMCDDYGIRNRREGFNQVFKVLAFENLPN